MTISLTRPTGFDPWFPLATTKPAADLILFCFPYAGGSAAAFAGWQERLPPFIDVRPIHLPGRERRLGEAPQVNVAEVADAVIRAADRPFAIFGHSMGARLAYEVVQELRRRRAAMPTVLLVSGFVPPHAPPPLSGLADLPDDELCDRVVELGGTPREVLADAGLRKLFLPVLRADLQVTSTRRGPTEPDQPVLDLPIVAIAGRDDELATPWALTGWSSYTAASFVTHTLPGGHFFLHSAQSELHVLITAELAGVTGRHRPAEPDPNADEVSVVEARLDLLPDLCAAVGELSNVEAQQAKRFVTPTHARRYIGRRVLLRRLLSQHGLDVGRADLSVGPRGKPELAGSTLRFNTSHSDGIAVIAMTNGDDVGVDIEKLCPLPDLSAFAAGALNKAERAELMVLPDPLRANAALRFWTAKEAVLKAVGEGMSRNPRHAGFAGQSGPVWRADDGRLSRWRVRHLDLPDAVIALAVAEDGYRLRYRTMRTAQSASST